MTETNAFSTNQKEFRFFVKIRKGSTGYASLASVVYFRNDMTFDFFYRWKWYFEYRAALYRVKEPRAYIEYSHGSYEYVLPNEVYRQKLKNLIRSSKAKLTEYNRKLNYAKMNWNQLFPIEDDPQWLKVMQQLEYYKIRLNDLLNEQDKLKL